MLEMTSLFTLCLPPKNNYIICKFTKNRSWSCWSLVNPIPANFRLFQELKQKWKRHPQGLSQST